MGQIKTVLFDLGNVIAHIDFDAFWRSVGLFTPREIAPFKEGYKIWTLQYETGHIPTSEYLNGLATVFNHRFTNEHLEQAVASIIKWPVEGMVELIIQISQTQQTALVSNTNEIHYNLSLKRFAALQILRKHYLSYELRVMKPDSGFYQTIIKDARIPPSEMLFIDDLESNVEGARLAGMKAIRFESVEKLKASLKVLLG